MSDDLENEATALHPQPPSQTRAPNVGRVKVRTFEVTRHIVTYDDIEKLIHEAFGLDPKSVTIAFSDETREALLTIRQLTGETVEIADENFDPTKITLGEV